VSAREWLTEGWEFLAVPAGTPLDTPVAGWQPARVPGTAASSLRALGQWSFETRRDFDVEDWWWRCTFAGSPAASGARIYLHLEGLATMAEVWLNGVKLLESRNMFLAHELDVTDALVPDNVLLLRFAALTPVLRARAPRPRWKTRLVAHQSLRLVRTTLLGRMPGWSPPVAPVGPWKPVSLERREGVQLTQVQLQSEAVGAGGRVHLRALLTGRLAAPARLRVEGEESVLAVSEDGEGRTWLAGSVTLGAVQRWWPHTHGQPHRSAVSVLLEGREQPCGHVGFRTVELQDQDGGFGLVVNGVPLFARGACWTPGDVAAVHGSEEDTARVLDLVVAAGMNMLRLSGTLSYESDAFHEACDARGILVWQDFMFANMDVPAEDPAFVASVEAEARQLLGRLARRPSLAVLCGNSEVEQQAAMMGLPDSEWRSSLFSETLPALCRELAPGVPYVPSTPSGGALPFHTGTGVTHYYGVGAYLRPLEDARRARVRLASECLALANVPGVEATHALMDRGAMPGHHPLWKERVPRDAGASWDFEDVRDHYLEVLFGVDARRLRTEDVERYLAASRVVSGEVMAAVFSEWRRAESGCAGGLVWFLRDLWPGAGWGVLDAAGEGKAAYFALARTLAPTALFFSDEGLDGLVLHACHDGPEPLEAELHFTAWSEAGVQVLETRAPVVIPGHGAVQRSCEAMLGHFADTARAYRFGPAAHALAMGELTRPDGTVLARAFHHPLALTLVPTLGLTGRAEALPDCSVHLHVQSAAFARSLALEVPGHVPEDNYFHLAPGMARTVRCIPRGGAPRFRASLRALNSPETLHVNLETSR